MGKIKRSEAQKYAKQQKRQAQMQSAAASQKEEGQKMPENRRRERETFEKRQQTEMKLSDEMLETIRKNAEQRFAMRKEEAREEKMSGESRESSVQRQIDGDGLIGEWEERYGKKKKKPERATGSHSIWRRPCSAAVTACVRAGRAGTAARSMTACTRT